MYSMLMAMHDLKEPYVKWSTEVLRHQQLEGAAESPRVHVEVGMFIFWHSLSAHLTVLGVGIMSRIRSNRRRRHTRGG